jgi:hypothetical protein
MWPRPLPTADCLPEPGLPRCARPAALRLAPVWPVAVAAPPGPSAAARPGAPVYRQPATRCCGAACLSTADALAARQLGLHGSALRRSGQAAVHHSRPLGALPLSAANPSRRCSMPPARLARTDGREVVNTKSGRPTGSSGQRERKVKKARRIC